MRAAEYDLVNTMKECSYVDYDRMRVWCFMARPGCKGRVETEFNRIADKYI